MTSEVKALIAEAIGGFPTEDEIRLYPLQAWQVMRALADALEAATVAPVVDREALVAVLAREGNWERDPDSYGWQFSPRLGADAILSSGIIRPEADVKAEALEKFAVMIRPTNPRNDWTDYAVGLGRAADQLEARARQIREARNA